MYLQRSDTALATQRDRVAPAIYYAQPLYLGLPDHWSAELSRIRALGFDHLCIGPAFAPGAAGNIFLTGDHTLLHPALGGGDADAGVVSLARLCAEHGLALMFDLVLDRMAPDGVLVCDRPQLFQLGEHGPYPAQYAAASARFDSEDAAQALQDWWRERIVRLVQAGVAAFRCDSPHKIPGAVWQEIIHAVDGSGCRFFAWTPGAPRAAVRSLAGRGFEGTFSSVAWWDGRASWFVEEHEMLRRVAPPTGFPEAPYGARLAVRSGESRHAAYRHALYRAMAMGRGLLVPMGFEYGAQEPLDPTKSEADALERWRTAAPFDLAGDIRSALALSRDMAAPVLDGELRMLTSPGAPVTVVLRTPRVSSSNALAVLINPDPAKSAPAVNLAPLPPAAGAAYGNPRPLGSEWEGPLAPGEVRLVRVERQRDICRTAQPPKRAARAAAAADRIAFERISPSVDSGAFAAKRVVGDRVPIEADIIADGHELLRADILWRAADEEAWRRAPMSPIGNDRWRGVLPLERVGRYLFTVEAWWDVYGTFCRELEIKLRAGVGVALEIEEGRRLLQDALQAKDDPVLGEVLGRLGEVEDKAALLLSARVRAAMVRQEDRPFLSRHEPPLPLDAERPQACFASWYELFPRSATDDANRHGTFGDVIRRLPAIRDMGFDVLYFPPIHPIGRTNRKGKNNSLKVTSGEPGSPYAIGSEEGGHDAIHPQLGTIEDFRRLRDEAARHGMEIALDFAIQCSPDHPWLTQHPEWFRWRPDGSLRYAENPPKKYEDIVNVDFYGEGAIPGLWVALRDVVLFWVREGVKTFRVDNPHTKPFPFWRWLIADIRAAHPDTIFLSEAFTRPKVMYRLAKIGFSQSYTYFIWRNTKAELTAYLTELTATEVRDFFRPHFFVNTPDINPIFLQSAGRAGFLIRAALATTLSGLWGMYSGFELCEAAPLPGREEYLDSEKYEIRVRDYAAPGNIVAEITALNRIRRAHPALQTHLGVTFYNAANDQVLVYGKATPPRHDMVLVAVSLDPHQTQTSAFEAPLWEWGLPDTGSLKVEDLMRGTSSVWTGKHQSVRLDPADLPFAIWRVAPLEAAP